MKKLIISGSIMFTIWTAVEPVWALDAASTSVTSVEQEGELFHFGDLNLHLNPQIGVSQFQYSGNSGGVQQKMAGGATVEFGDEARKVETGLLFLQSGANATLSNGATTRIDSSYITVPMMAKLRVLKLQSQSWFIKFGVMSAFQSGSSDRADTNAFDLLGSVGLAGRFPVNATTDFIVEATYNHGFMNAFDTANPGNFNQGVLMLAGLSFRL